MKAKFLFVTVAVATFVGNVFGQGQVTLANNASSLIYVGAINTSGPPVPVGSMFFQLYFGPEGTTEASLVPVGPVVGTSTVVAGRIANTVIDIPTAIVPAGGVATFQIWGWSSSFASYAAAVSGGGWNGKSIPFNANTSPNIQPPPAPTTLAGLYPGFGVVPWDIPEPSTFVLVGLGVASLLLNCLRR